MGNSQQMKYGIGGASHGNIQGHRILKRIESGNVSGQHILITILVITKCIFYKLMSCFFK